MPTMPRNLRKVRDLSDWDQSSFADGEVPRYNGSLGKYQGASPTIRIRKGTAPDVGVRSRIAFYEGSNVTLGISDDPTNDAVGVTISAATAATALVSVAHVTSNYSIAGGDGVILADAITMDLTVTLPGVSTSSGRQYIVKKIDGSTHLVQVSAQVGETIDGQAGVLLSVPYDAITVVCNGSAWFLV